MEGALSKWTNVVKGWQYRWFVLDDNAGLFSYYTSKEKMMRGVRRGCVRLRGAIIGIDDEDDSTFIITVDGKTFHFQAQDSEERERWIRALEDTVLRHNQARRGISRSKMATSGGAVKVEDFERKLAETDSYLQLLLNQVAALKVKMSDPDLSKESFEMYTNVEEKATNMTESIKHAIVLLQIAKNAAMPAESLTSPKRTTTHDASPIVVTDACGISKTMSPINRPSFLHEVGLADHPIELGIEVGSECQENRSSSGEVFKRSPSPRISTCRKSPPNLKPLKSCAIPDISYSSSEDEDFFDAEDEENEMMMVARDKENLQAQAAVITNPFVPTPSIVAIREKSLEINNFVSSEASTNDALPNDILDDVDYDALYEEADNDNEDVDMKNHGSVITHLLSQVRIGMDLTKIVLPTFILERRSLLEMYSDFFAHPDIFLDITDGKDPEERMIRVLRWYLSSFHAGRKSTIAKKPYNPILGETFRCLWKTKDPSSCSSSTYLSPPRPWSETDQVSPDDLTFVAEQVSHHPPMSAFYAEHIKKRISFNAFIYTKSSFLGMSVGVHNQGHGTVSLLDLGEEYIVTFPSGYCRSILSVPWVELGGKVSVQCPKTGYVSNIEFKCKPFFSSEVNKVTAEVFPPNSKKSVLRVDGEWNGKLMVKYASGQNEVFMDVSKIPIHKKICRKVALQDPFESRRLWRQVTYGLKVGDIDAATAAKSALEKRQREEALERKESNSNWDTKLFHPVGENWFFDQPLESRIVAK